MNIRNGDRVHLVFLGPAQATGQLELIGEVDRRTTEDGIGLRLRIVLFQIIELAAGNRVGCDQANIHGKLCGIKINFAALVEGPDHEIEHAVKVTGDAQFLGELLCRVAWVTTADTAWRTTRQDADITITVDVDGFEIKIAGNRRQGERVRHVPIPFQAAKQNVGFPEWPSSRRKPTFGRRTRSKNPQ